MPFVTDLFTDTSGTALPSHTPDLGGTWIEHPNFTAGGAQISNANRCRGLTGNNEVSFLYNDEIPSGADYDVEVIVRRVTGVVGSIAGVIGRASSSASTWYEFSYDFSDGEWALFKRVAGTVTFLDSFIQTLSNDTDYTVKLEMRGSTIKGYVDTVERVSVVDTAVTAAGFAGIKIKSGTGGGSDTAGLHLDSFNATSASADLIVQNASHTHSAENAVLTQVHSLVVANASHAHTVGNLALTQNHVLSVSNASHGHSADNLALTQVHNLIVSDASHGHTVDNLGLTQSHSLIVASATHGHTAENLTLDTAFNLSIQSGLHLHTAEALTLTQVHNLTVSNASHSHEAQNLTLGTQLDLVISNAIHGHTSSNISFAWADPRDLYIVPAETRSITVSTEGRQLVIPVEDRTFEA